MKFWNVKKRKTYTDQAEFVPWTWGRPTIPKAINVPFYTNGMKEKKHMINLKMQKGT